MLKPYFSDQGGPPPLAASCQRIVRLEEVDALGIVWHGRYPSYFEDGREELGRRFGLSYCEFQAAGVVMPIRSLTIDYLSPLKYMDTIAIEAELHWHEAARLNIAYKIFGPDGRLATSGATIQLMVDLSGGLLLEAPAFFLDFQKKWLEGTL
jgi:acyl-CoA thioester hydrolase